jgi:hypothetical protein
MDTMTVLWSVLLVVGAFFPAEKIVRGLRARDRPLRIVDAAARESVVAIMALQFLMPWRPAQLVALVVMCLLVVRNLFGLRSSRRRREGSTVKAEET